MMSKLGLRHQRQEAFIRSETVSHTLANGVDLQRRRLYVFGEIDDMVSHRFIVGLHSLDDVKGPITVVLSTPGGSCEDGFAIYDAIRFARNDVYCVAFGQVASMGAIIMQAGTKRLMSPECELMIHNVGTSGSDGLSLEEAKTLSANLQRLQARANRILAERSKQSLSKITEWCKSETTFGAALAVKEGFVDQVISRSLPVSGTRPSKKRSVK